MSSNYAGKSTYFQFTELSLFFYEIQTVHYCFCLRYGFFLVCDYPLWPIVAVRNRKICLEKKMLEISKVIPVAAVVSVHCKSDFQVASRDCPVWVKHISTFFLSSLNCTQLLQLLPVGLQQLVFRRCHLHWFLVICLPGSILNSFESHSYLPRWWRRSCLSKFETEFPPDVSSRWCGWCCVASQELAQLDLHARFPENLMNITQTGTQRTDSGDDQTVHSE